MSTLQLPLSSGAPAPLLAAQKKGNTVPGVPDYLSNHPMLTGLLHTDQNGLVTQPNYFNNSGQSDSQDSFQQNPLQGYMQYNYEHKPGDLYNNYDASGNFTGQGVFKEVEGNILKDPMFWAMVASAFGMAGVGSAIAGAGVGATGGAGGAVGAGTGAGIGGAAFGDAGLMYAGADAAAAAGLGGGGTLSSVGALGGAAGGLGGGGATTAGASGSLFPGVSNSTLLQAGGSLATSALGGGGGSGVSDMRSEEAQRQARVQAAVDAINKQFGIGTGAESNKTARESLYSDISGAVRDTAMRDVDRQYSKASRANTFGLARAGLLGGSVDAESGGELSELYGEGKLKASQAGQQAASDLRVSDEKSRQNLIGLAQSGLDTGTSASLAAGQMSAAADLARADANTASVGRLFDDLSQAYVTNQTMKARYPNGIPQSTGYSTPNLWGSKRYVGSVQGG